MAKWATTTYYPSTYDYYLNGVSFLCACLMIGYFVFSNLQIFLRSFRMTCCDPWVITQLHLTITTTTEVLAGPVVAAAAALITHPDRCRRSCLPPVGPDPSRSDWRKGARAWRTCSDLSSRDRQITREMKSHPRKSKFTEKLKKNEADFQISVTAENI